MIPISILGQPTKDDVAEGKRGRERGKDTVLQSRHFSYIGNGASVPLSISFCPNKLVGILVSSSNDSGPTQLELSEGLT